MKCNPVLIGAILLFVSCGSPPESSESPSIPAVQHPTERQDTTQQDSRVSDAQQRLRDRQQPSDASEPMRHRLNVAPFDYFTDSDGYLSLEGVTDTRLDEVLGKAPIVVRQAVDGAPLRREVRVYLPYEEDSTGLYIFIRNNRVERFRLDTFLGLANSSIIQDYFQN